ncbi:MAG: 50S ribosomal protein L11 methyltransferase [Bacteroidales bacterium]|nr:50S ribosomal protein L11 methyltransferase [Bacteroidales bacterium]
MDYTELHIAIAPLSDDGRDIVVAQLADMGYESFMDAPDGLLAYAQALPERSPQHDAAALQAPEGTELRASWRTIADQNWNALWEASFDPIVVDGRCAIRASFHAPHPQLEHDIVIDPQMSFGTGHHQTTRLMVRALLGTPLSGLRVLDMGCGTGVLAILAEQRGAQQVLAIDIEEWAHRNALDNVALNRCQHVQVLQGGAELLGGRTFDVLLANINLNVLLADMPTYRKCMAPKAALLTSGILDADVPTLAEHAARHGLRTVRTELLEGWAMMAFEIGRQ